MEAKRDNRFLSGKNLVMFLIVIASIIFPWIASPGNATEQPQYTIAVIPSSPPVTMHTQWSPLLERLTEKTGIRFSLKLFDRMAEFEREIGEGTPDFIFASPIQTVVAHQSHGYVPLVRGSKLIGIGLFVRRDSSIKNLDDLTGKTISFVGNKNFCSVFIRHLLARRDRPLTFTSNYAGSTRNVIKSVLLGKSSAGAVFIPELEREPPENREQLRAIVETSKIAPHPFSAHPRVPSLMQDKVKNSLLEIAADRDGAEVLSTIRLSAPVAADYRKDYQSLELIDIRELTDWGK